ncbi:MAG: Tim44 domain-containing protein [Burkholderiales bacterium]|nr:Tim44 domain-containing protein [Burkholderiales bacterium]
MDNSITRTSSRAVAVACRLGLLAIFTAIGLSLTIPDADARRLGGGKSFGRQSQQAAPPSQPPARNSVGQQGGQQATPAQAAPTQATPATAGKPAAGAAGGNRFLGPLAGLAAGLGIAALLAHLGLIGPFAEFLAALLMVGLLVLAGLFIWRMLRGGMGGRREVSQRTMEPAYQSPSIARSQEAPLAVDMARPGSVAASLGGSSHILRAPGVPEDFDVAAFLRNAKVHFHRLQTAWERKDVEDLNEFTTHEVLAELRMQMAEEDGDHSEIVALDADLLGIEEGPSDYLASVRFSGNVRHAGADVPEAFQEVWNLSKRKDGRSGWLLAGVQQIH